MRIKRALILFAIIFGFLGYYLRPNWGPDSLPELLVLIVLFLLHIIYGVLCQQEEDEKRHNEANKRD